MSNFDKNGLRGNKLYLINKNTQVNTLFVIFFVSYIYHFGWAVRRARCFNSLFESDSDSFCWLVLISGDF